MTKRAKRQWKSDQLRHCPRCDYCNRVLNIHTATLDHIAPLSRIERDHLPEEDKTNWALACSRCNYLKGSQTLRESRMHLLRRRTSTGLSPCCDLCGRYFRTPKGLRAHRRSVHGLTD